MAAGSVSLCSAFCGNADVGSMRFEKINGPTKALCRDAGVLRVGDVPMRRTHASPVALARYRHKFDLARSITSSA